MAGRWGEYKERGKWGKCNVLPGQSFNICPFYERNGKDQPHCYFLKDRLKCVNQLLYPDKDLIPEELFEI